MRGRWGCVFICIFGSFMAGCNGAKVDEQLANTATLAQNKQAIALFRVARPDPSCVSLAVQLGMREGALFRPIQTLRLQQTQVTQVAEVLLSPGEYHVVSVACVRARSTLVLWEPQGGGLLRRSYATFSLAAGEVVNLGEIRVVDQKRTHGVWNSFHAVGVEIGDWPLAELERFKSQRPKLYAEMRVRLMTANAITLTPEVVGQKCQELKRLQAEGKIQNLPSDCAAPLPTAKREQKA